ncbi:MAG: c-type cytochrome [Chloroflexi bacterium]|nr:c-type cytochrome [Chloroflexota bacterium]
MNRELFAALVVIVIVIGFPASLFAYQAWRTNAAGVRVIDLTANVPADGGWQPDTIRVRLGERVRLRISSPDVVHGFVVPALGIKVDEILPGHVQEVEFVASRVGRFPFACTRWCSVDHWRMRGVIEVVDPQNPTPVLPTTAPPLYQQLKLDIDEPHPAQNLPSTRPSAARGATLANPIAIDADTQTQSPSDVFARLRSERALSSYGDTQLWDAIAFEWKRAAGDAAIARGQQLYARDCAACHGESSAGDGPAGRELPGRAAIDPGARRGPADLGDASQMLGASDALLQGKVLRGGMGTGMPEWRSLYADQDIGAVTSYIRSFVFDYGLSQSP